MATNDANGAQETASFFKVVFPGGINVRSAMSFDAETTGQVLTKGTVFEAQSVQEQQGVAFVQLKDGRGWVFEKSKDTVVLKRVSGECLLQDEGLILRPSTAVPSRRVMPFFVTQRSILKKILKSFPHPTLTPTQPTHSSQAREP